MPGGPSDPKSWYARGASDLTLALRALDPAEPLAELAAYHAQQGAEKYLKGFLVSRSVAFRFVHDLGVSRSSVPARCS
jgi:HEPN domain-containing protein